MSAQHVQNLKVKKYDPGNAKRAKQYPQETWDQFWPKFRELKAQGLKYNDILSQIKDDPQALAACFRPTLPQLEKQLRERRRGCQEWTGIEDAPGNDGDQNTHRVIKVSMADAADNRISVFPWDHHPLPFEAFPGQEGVSEDEKTPSLTTGSTTDQLPDAQTPSAPPLLAPCYDDVQADGLYVPMDANLVGMTPSDPSVVGESSLASLGQDMHPAPVDSRMQLDTDINMEDDTSVGTEYCGTAFYFPSKMKSSGMSVASGASSHSSWRLYGSGEVTQPVDKQPLKLNDCANGLLRMKSSPAQWKQYIRNHEKVLYTDPLEFLGAAIESRVTQRNGKARSCLDCMSLVWAWRTLPRAAFDEMLNHLVLSEARKASPLEQETEAVFFSATERNLAVLDEQIASTRGLITAELLSPSAIFLLKLSPPVLSERFHTLVTSRLGEENL